MSDRVSEIFHFVLEHGSIAEEVLFHDEEEDGPLGLTEAEREAIAGIEPHLEASWIGVLSSCREALWRLNADHHTRADAHKRKGQKARFYEREYVEIPLIAGLVGVGFSLTIWGASAQYQLHTWVWVHERYRQLAESVVDGLQLPIWRNEAGSFILTLGVPDEGEAFSDIGARSAEALWKLARPIADAVRETLDHAP